MTIDSVYAPELFNVDPGLVYEFEFEHVGDTAVFVYEIDGGGNRFLKTAGVDYTLDLSISTPPIYQGGVVTFLIAHAPGIVQVEIARDTPETQLIDYGAYTPFPAETHEFALDKLTMLVQELTGNVGLGGGGEGGDCTAYIPLTGNDPNVNPITGDLFFKDPLAQGVYVLNHGLSFAGDGQLMLLQTSDPKSEFWIQTRSDSGNSSIFQFGRDGSLNLPQEGTNEVLNLRVENSLGADRVLNVRGFDGNGNQQNNALIWHVTPTVNIAFQEDGEVQAGRQTDGTSGPFTLTTKQYVDSLLAPGAGESNTSSNQGLGVGLALPKSAVDLPFRTLQNTDGNITVQLDGSGNEVNIDLNSNLTLDTLNVTSLNADRVKQAYLGPYDADDVPRWDQLLLNFVQLTRQISTGDGLQGGGNLNSDLNLSILLAPSSGLSFSAGGLAVDPFAYMTTATDQSGLGGKKTWDVAPACTVDPTASNDLCRKSYVDGLVGGIGSFVPVSGGNFTGEVTCDFVTNSGGASTLTRKDYVDLLISGVNDYSIGAGDGLSGGGNIDTSPSLSVDSTVIRTTGNQTLGGNKTFSSQVTLPGTNPTADNHAARKAYVDFLIGGVNVYNIGAGSGLTGGGQIQTEPTLNVGQGDGINVTSNAVAVNSSVIRTSGGQTISGYLSATGVTSSGGTAVLTRKDYVDFLVSDQSWKTNVKPITTPWVAINAVEFDWLPDAPKQGHAAGFIAQDVERALPDAVGAYEDGKKGIDLSQIVALLWAQNQDLKARVEALGG